MLDASASLEPRCAAPPPALPPPGWLALGWGEVDPRIPPQPSARTACIPPAGVQPRCRARAQTFTVSECLVFCFQERGGVKRKLPRTIRNIPPGKRKGGTPEEIVVSPKTPESPQNQSSSSRACPRTTSSRRAQSSTPHSRYNPGFYEPTPGLVGGGSGTPPDENPMGSQKEKLCFLGLGKNPGLSSKKGEGLPPHSGSQNTPPVAGQPCTPSTPRGNDPPRRRKGGKSVHGSRGGSVPSSTEREISQEFSAPSHMVSRDDSAAASAGSSSDGTICRGTPTQQQAGASPHLRVRTAKKFLRRSSGSSKISLRPGTCLFQRIRNRTDGAWRSRASRLRFRSVVPGTNGASDAPLGPESLAATGHSTPKPPGPVVAPNFEQPRRPPWASPSAQKAGGEGGEGHGANRQQGVAPPDVVAPWIKQLSSQPPPVPPCRRTATSSAERQDPDQDPRGPGPGRTIGWSSLGKNG